MVDIVQVQHKTGTQETLIKCIHCSGSGICKHSAWIAVYNGSESEREYLGQALSCDYCGKGTISVASYSFWGRPTSYNSPPPMCRVCGGKGVARII